MNIIEKAVKAYQEKKHEILKNKIMAKELEATFAAGAEKYKNMAKELEAAFVAGAEWYKNTGGGISELWKRSIPLEGLYTFDEAQKACPEGYRLPTREEQEWLVENSQYNFDKETKEGVFRLPDGFELRLPAAGNRLDNGDSYGQGTIGFYWSSSLSGTGATGVYFNGGTAGVGTGLRVNAFSVRCVPKKPIAVTKDF